jgi:hypothetical protein
MVLLSIATGGCEDRPAAVPSQSAMSSRPDSPDRCVGLPDVARSGGKNSDGTLKRLPPGPPGQPGFTVLFRYEDFGPQAMQNGILGSEWWSWESGGSFALEDEFDIRVVVYQKQPREKAEADYPTSKGRSDYRLIERGAALAYVDERLKELAAMDPDDPYDWGPLRKRLQQTRDVITTCLPE